MAYKKPDYANGIYFNFPKGNAPEFVVGKISVKRAEFIKLLQSMNDEYARFDVVRVKDDPNRTYITIDNFKPTKQKESNDEEIDANDI